MQYYDCQLIEYNGDKTNQPFVSSIEANFPDDAARIACPEFAQRHCIYFEDGDVAVVQVTGDEMDEPKRYEISTYTTVDFEADEIS